MTPSRKRILDRALGIMLTRPSMAASDAFAYATLKEFIRNGRKDEAEHKKVGQELLDTHCQQSRQQHLSKDNRMSAAPNTPPIDKIVQAHHNIKQARADLKRKFEEEDAELEGQQQKLRAFLLNHLNQTGVQSMKTEAGTVYKTKRTIASATDWASVWAFAKENDAMDIFQKRLTTSFVTEYAEQHDGAIPPGVRLLEEFDIGVRE